MTAASAWSVYGGALCVFDRFSCLDHMCFIYFSEKMQQFLGKNDRSFFGHEKSTCYFAVFCLHLHSEKMSWLHDDICGYILLIGINGSYVWFFTSLLKQSAWLCIWPDPKVIFFVWLFRILVGPGFCMRFILQNPGWVCGAGGRFGYAVRGVRCGLGRVICDQECAVFELTI